MASFEEELAKQRLWQWLEESKGLEVDGEVDLGTGRIDLVGKTSSGEIWGIEIKRSADFESVWSMFKQVRRYIESGQIDRVFFATPGDNPVDAIKETSVPSEVGVIHVPIPIDGDTVTDAEELLSTHSSVEVPIINKFMTTSSHFGIQILREAGLLNAKEDSELSISRAEEPWVRHHVWRNLGGIPEGHIPNVKDSDMPSRPIDLITFEGAIDATEVVKNPNSSAVIGVEVKGKTSFSDSRTRRQLRQFVETETLTRLYLAVPNLISDKAVNLIANNSEFKNIGVIAVSKDGTVDFIKEASRMQPKYDGYLKRSEKRKIGYGELTVDGSEQVANPYITEEEAERFQNPDPEMYAKDIIKDHSHLTDSDSFIRSQDHSLSDRTEDSFDKQGVRCYLVWGSVADPYFVNYDPSVEEDELMKCYVTLRIECFTLNNGKGFKLKFGHGPYTGGYIWLNPDSVQKLLDTLVSIETVKGGIFKGQGKIIDLETFPFESADTDHLALDGQYGNEEILELQIRRLTDSGKDDRIFEMDLGENAKAGAKLQFTRSQWYDILTTLHILLNDGSVRQLPFIEGEFPRIGPSGGDTWDLGSINKTPDATPPEKWKTEYK